MWSSPAALEKVKLSASRTSNGPQSFFSTSQVLYHFRTISSAVVLFPALARALAVTENAAAPTRAQAPASSAFRRDTPILAMSILLLSFVVWAQAYEPVGMQNAELSLRNDAISPSCGCPAREESSASPRCF